MVRFRMFRINVEQFAILTDCLSKNEVVIETSLGVRHAVIERKIAIDMAFYFSVADEKVMLLKLTCEFEIHPDDWKSFIEDNKTVILPKDIIEYFGAQTVGTARGILHCKTEGTPFNCIVLPPMDVTKMIQKDVEININVHK